MNIAQQTKNTDSVLISFASKGREDYNKGLQRLIQSAKQFWSGDMFFYSLDTPAQDVIFLNGIMPEGCRLHKEVPYQFKYGLIDMYRKQGYKKILWLDSTMVINEDPIELLNTPVMAFHNLGHPLHKYINDTCLKLINETPESIKFKDGETGIQTWGGAIGFNFEYKEATEILKEGLRLAELGAFNDDSTIREGFASHRHDQSVMSYLFHSYNIPLLPYGKIVCSPHYLPPYEYGTDFYFISKPNE